MITIREENFKNLPLIELRIIKRWIENELDRRLRLMEEHTKKGIDHDYETKKKGG